MPKVEIEGVGTYEIDAPDDQIGDVVDEIAAKAGKASVAAPPEKHAESAMAAGLDKIRKIPSLLSPGSRVDPNSPQPAEPPLAPGMTRVALPAFGALQTDRPSTFTPPVPLGVQQGRVIDTSRPLVPLAQIAQNPALQRAAAGMGLTPEMLDVGAEAAEPLTSINSLTQLGMMEGPAMAGTLGARGAAAAYAPLRRLLGTQMLGEAAIPLATEQIPEAAGTAIGGDTQGLREQLPSLLASAAMTIPGVMHELAGGPHAEARPEQVGPRPMENEAPYANAPREEITLPPALRALERPLKELFQKSHGEPNPTQGDEYGQNVPAQAETAPAEIPTKPEHQPNQTPVPGAERGGGVPEDIRDEVADARTEDRRGAEEPVGGRRLAERRSAIAQEYGRAEDDPLVARVAEAEERADTDPVTGLRSAAAYKREAPEHQGPVASVDLAGLGFINDNLGGHSVGDDVLGHLGRAIAEEPGITGYRKGGDEIVLHGHGDEAELQGAADRIQQRFADAEWSGVSEGKPVRYMGGRIDYGIGPDFEAADQGLYRAREEAVAAGVRSPVKGARPQGLSEVSGPGDQSGLQVPEQVTAEVARPPGTLLSEIVAHTEAAKNLEQPGLFSHEELSELETKPPTMDEIYQAAKETYEQNAIAPEDGLFAQEKGSPPSVGRGGSSEGASDDYGFDASRSLRRPERPTTPESESAGNPNRGSAGELNQSDGTRGLGKGDMADALKKAANDGKTPPKPRVAHPEPRFATEPRQKSGNAFADGVRQVKVDTKKVMAPGTRSDAALVIGESYNEHNAERKVQEELTRRRSEKAWDYFSRADKKTVREFLKKVEADSPADRKQPTPELQEYADKLRQVLDEGRDRVRSVGTGALSKFYENYFPHMWEDADAAAKFVDEWAKKSMEGGKGWMKQRTYPTIEDGLNAGLKLKFENPVDAVMAIRKELDKYVMAHQVLNEGIDHRSIQYVPVDTKPPSTWEKLDDKISTLFGRRRVDVEEHVDGGLLDKLEAFFDRNKITHERNTNMGGPAGASVRGKAAVHTAFGSPISVMVHELGHVLDDRYGLADKVQSTEVRAELRELARKRHDGLSDFEVDQKFASYVQKPGEQIANFLDAYINHREMAKEIAPAMTEKFESFLDRHPEISDLRDIKPTLRVDSREGTVDAGGIVTKGHYWAPKEVAQLLNNTLKPGLSGKGWYRGALRVNGEINRLQLMSGFHAGFVALEAPISQVALGIREALNPGTRMAGIKDIATAPGALFRNIKRGREMQKAMFGEPGSVGERAYGDAARAQSGGGRFLQDHKWSHQARDAYKQALGQKEIKALPYALRAGLEKVTSYIPDIVTQAKLGAIAKLTAFEMERLGPDADPIEYRHAYARAVASVENRLGQMTYSNLHWNPLLKDIAQLTTRSVGWNLGSIREYGGGIADLATLRRRVGKEGAHLEAVKEWTKLKDDLETKHAEELGAYQNAQQEFEDGNISEKEWKKFKEPKAPEIPERPINLKDPAVTNRMAYWAATGIMTAIYGYATSLAMTGHGPKDLKDWAFPRTGGKNPDGSDERISTPTYGRDLQAYRNQPLQTIAHKTSPLLGMTAQMLQNRDYYGTEIFHPGDGPFGHLASAASYLGKTALPFGVQQAMKQDQNPDTRMPKWLNQVGFTASPAYVTRDPGRKEMDRLSQNKAPMGTRTKAEFERSQARQKLETELRYNKEHGDNDRVTRAGIDKEVAELTTRGVLRPTDRRDIFETAQKTSDQVKLEGLTLPQITKAYDESFSPDEKKELRVPILKKLHNRRDWARMTQDERKSTRDFMKRILAR